MVLLWRLARKHLNTPREECTLRSKTNPEFRKVSRVLYSPMVYGNLPDNRLKAIAALMSEALQSRTLIGMLFGIVAKR